MYLKDEEPQEPAPDDAIIHLEDEYRHCLIGHSVSPNGKPRFVYSLTKLVKHEHSSMLLNPDIEIARASVWGLVQAITDEFGDRAPLFVDDAISRPKAPKSLILLPNGRHN